ncbi:MAG: hypothetical protein EXS46_01990 [Candidatus Taylorbacteria bacterium]|nr:hypothetical protein [Candidatus Taylorbacteria bacterium]
MDAKQKEIRIKELEEAMNAPDFWADKNRAQAAIKELQNLKVEIESYDQSVTAVPVRETAADISSVSNSFATFRSMKNIVGVLILASVALFGLSIFLFLDQKSSVPLISKNISDKTANVKPVVTQNVIANFVTCLRDSGSSFYENGNMESVAEKSLFGVASYDLPFATCTTDETDVTKSKFDFCMFKSDPTIKYPVWVFPDGTQFDSSVDAGNLFTLLSQKTKCSLPRPSIGLAARISLPPDAISIAVSEQYVYVVSYGPDREAGGSLQVFDVSDTSKPLLLHTTLLKHGPQAIAVSGKFAYIVDVADSLLEIFDISLPSKPVRIAEVSTLLRPRSIVVQGKYAYITSVGAANVKTYLGFPKQENGYLQVIDISNPIKPLPVGQTVVGEYPVDVAVDSHYAYVLSHNSGDLQILDVSIPTEPSLVSNTYIGPDSVSLALSGKYLYVTISAAQGQILALDISNPNRPPQGRLGVTPARPVWLFSSGGNVYSVDYPSKIFQIFDATQFDDQSYLYGTAGVSTYGNPVRVFISQPYAYIISEEDKNSWLEIFKI